MQSPLAPKKKMSASRLVAALTLLLAACATASFQPYEGRDAVREGAGGTKLVVDGVDIWANGTPPRRYEILGVVVSEIGGIANQDSAIRSAVAGEVKKRGGDAAIEMSRDSSYGGQIGAMASTTRSMRFAVIRYL